MSPRSLRLLPLLVLCLLFSAAAAPSVAKEEEDPIPVQETGQGLGEWRGQTFPLGYTVTPLGVLVGLSPINGRLGGELEIGPLGQSHEVTLGSASFIFGPGSAAVIFDEEILPLSQPPRFGTGGLQVPIDLLERVYGELLGYDFRWVAGERQLTLAQRQMRELPLAVDLVHLQGVSTLVLRFESEPRFRIEDESGSITVAMLGDRAKLLPGQQLGEDPLIESVHVTEEEIKIRLAPGNESEHYALDGGRRLVFEVYPGRQAIEISGSPDDDDDDGPTRQKPRVETIVIDPGHGGRDSGAKGSGGLTEKELTLRLARSLKSKLERAYSVRVVLTRTEDAYLPLETRTALANQHDADLFLSLHLNAARGSHAHGAETYFLSLQASDENAERLARAENLSAGDAAPGDAGLDDLELILWDMAQTHHLNRSQTLAKFIQSELNERMGITNRGVKQAPFRVLMGATMPAVLVEVGFLSNDDEARRLAEADYREELVDGLVTAIGRYREIDGPVRTARTEASADEETP